LWAFDVTRILQRGRLIFMVAALGVCFLVVTCRLVELQVLRSDDFRDQARRQQRWSAMTQPMRGDIRDIRGNLLATSVPVKTVCVDPALITNYQAEVARVLAPALQVGETSLLASFRDLTRWVTNEHQVRLVTNRCVVLQRNVPGDTWTNLQDSLLWNYKFHCTNVLARKQVALEDRAASRSWKSWLPGRSRARQARLSDTDKLPLRNAWFNSVFAVDDELRQYPNDKLAAHVLGFTGKAEQEISGRIISQSVGAEGIEASFNDKLTGVCGWSLGYADGRKHEMVGLREQSLQPRPGLNVVLTLDLRIQQILEEELAAAVAKHAPQGACAIAVRPATGEILGLASWPSFDPNDIRSSRPEWRRNRVIVDCAEPGSTFKIVTVAAALNDRLVALEDRFDCEHGRYSYAGKILRDHEAYGVLSVEEIVTKSSNIGTAKIAMRMGEQRLYQYIRANGFGLRTGLPLGGESSGIVHPVDKWSKLSISRIPMGQGVAATPLQMVMAMATIANGGTLMRPMLVDHTEDDQRHVVTLYKPIPVHRVISERAVRDTIKALKSVVSKSGTANRAILEHYTVAGKTGTAEKPGAGGYLPGKYFSSFVGFFPADAAEMVIGVFLDEPNVKTGYYGGQVAAPAFKNMAERIAHYANIRPDILPLPTGVPGEAATLSDSKPGRAPGGRL
jgi:cell division protein FtsI/penicillin-binding protein 2